MLIFDRRPAPPHLALWVDRANKYRSGNLPNNRRVEVVMEVRFDFGRIPVVNVRAPKVFVNFKSVENHAIGVVTMPCARWLACV